MNTGITIENEVPHVNGEPAVKDDTPPLIDTLSNWRCPFCEARLAKNGYICLNGCHLSHGTVNRLARRGLKL